MPDPLHQATEVLTLEDFIAAIRATHERLLEREPESDEPVSFVCLALRGDYMEHIYRNAAPNVRQWMLNGALFIDMRDTWGPTSPRS